MKRPIWKGPTIRNNFNNEKAIWKGNSTLPDLLKGAIKFSYQEGKASWLARSVFVCAYRLRANLIARLATSLRHFLGTGARGGGGAGGGGPGGGQGGAVRQQEQAHSRGALIGNLLFGEKINSIHPHKIWIHIATNDFLIKSSAINLVLNMTVCEKMQLQVPGSSAARQRLIEVGGISQKQLSAVQFDWYQFRPFTPRTMLPLKATNSTHQQRH